MKIIKILIILFIINAPAICYAIDAKRLEGLIADIETEKYEKVEKFLDNQQLLRDPEYYVVLLNYIIARGNQKNIVVAKGKPEEGDFSINDQKTNEAVGFIGERGGYDEKLILDGILKTNQALQFFKSRLDIRLGLMSAAEKIKKWEILGEQLVETLEVSREIDNKWMWGSINSNSEDPKDLMLESIQTYIANLFRVENPVADQALIKSSEALVKYYPNVIYGYSNLAVINMAKNEYDKAEQYLKQAQKIDPNDQIVKGNLEILMKRKNKKQKSVNK